jgi:hypothetical protein
MATALPFFQDVTFDPEATRIMGEAFDRACQALGGRELPIIVQEAIAIRIVDEAIKGERDPDHLFKYAVKGTVCVE